MSLSSVFFTARSHVTGLFRVVGIIIGVVFVMGRPAGNAAVDELFDGIPPAAYLTGRFAPSAHPRFVAVAKAGIPADGTWIYIRIEAAAALAALYRDFHAEHPKVIFRVRSGCRTWDDQKSIWEGKWTGRSTVMNKRLNEEIKDQRKRALEILKYSSMPGTSRHHWGTDIDIGELFNGYYRSGPGKVLYDWMTKNAARYGFCQPYTAGRSDGYAEEMWHWSYIPLAGPLLIEWNRRYRDYIAPLLGPASFAGAASASDLASRYVNEINPRCRAAAD